jgi:hypothetical protein
MKKIVVFFLTFISVNLIFVAKTLAVCPLCTIAVGAGVGLSRYLGIDDSIAGLWVGGLTVSLIAWTIDWFNRKQIAFKGRKIITVLGYYLLIVVPLYYTGIMGHPLNSLFCFCGVHFDKLMLGIIIGSFGFYLGASWYDLLKAKNSGRAYFPYQKVVMPISSLIILSFIFYFLTK